MNEGLKKRAQRFIDERREEILKLCSDMVRIPSENPPGDMGEMASFLRDFLEKKGLAVEAYEPERGRINLVVKIGAGEPTLILNGHMDVVPAGNRGRWDFPPYCGELREGKILGRGATDMKGGLTSIISAFTAISGGPATCRARSSSPSCRMRRPAGDTAPGGWWRRAR